MRGNAVSALIRSAATPPLAAEHLTPLATHFIRSWILRPEFVIAGGVLVVNTGCQMDP
jgi:hypothetical protein